MDTVTKYTFVPLENKNYPGFNDKRTQELLMKWGIKENISIQSFSFNEPFQPYLKYHLAESFFKDATIAKELKTKKFNTWCNEGIVATEINAEQIPCSILEMSFFNKLKDPDNRITYDSNKICKSMRYNDEGDMITDNLKAMLLDPECQEYKLYEDIEKKEFIFQIMQMLVLGGRLCQYEDILEPYLQITKSLYKDLIIVDKLGDSNGISISTIVLKVVAIKSGEPYFPKNVYDEKKNIAFLLVDPAYRQITTFLHQLDVYEDWKKLST